MQGAVSGISGKSAPDSPYLLLRRAGLPADNHAGVAHTYDASPVGNNGQPGMGRRLRMQPDCPVDDAFCNDRDAEFHRITNNHILVSIAQAFGVDVDSFGTQPDPQLTTGALSELAG